MLSGLPRKSFSRKQAFVDINAFLRLRKQRPRFAQGQPNVWINAIVFVPTARTSPKAGAKQLSYNSLNLSMKDKAIAGSILVSDQTDLFRFATYGDEYGVPRKILPRKKANIYLFIVTGHQIRPGVICPRLFLKERT